MFPMAEKIVYPKMPESNWWAVRAQFRKTIPSSVTASYLKTLLNLTSEKAASNLLSPLKQTKIIDDENKPTSRAIDWRDDTKYKDICQQIAEEIYPTELREIHQGPDFDKEAITNWFMSNAHLGEGAAKSTTAFYILLSTGEVRTDIDTLPAAKSKKSKKTKLEKRIVSNDIHTDRDEQKQTANKGESAASTSRNLYQSPSLHIDLQVHISSEASVQQVDAIFASIAKHLYEK